MCHQVDFRGERGRSSNKVYSPVRLADKRSAGSKNRL